MMRSVLGISTAIACWAFAIAAEAAGLPIDQPAPLKQTIASVPKNCPRIYVPVCALTQSQQLETFYNRCAIEAGAVILHQAACYGLHCSRDIINGGVCAKNATTGAIGWYDNICWAEKNWAIFLHYGASQSCAQ